MPIELLLIVCLVVIFLVPIFFDVNVGIVAFITAFLVGALAMDLSARQVLAGFPDNMFVMLVGITLLLAIAHQNGTVDWIVAKLVRAARGRLVLLPWVLFVTALVTASLGPVAAPVLFVIGENDSRCPLGQALAYVDRIKELGKPHETYLFSTGHGSHETDEGVRQLRVILKFLKTHVPGLNDI